MKPIEPLLVALRIWFITVTINGVLLGFWTNEWEVVLYLVGLAAVFTLPIPFIANYCIKLACLLSNLFELRFLYIYFFLVMLAGLFWAIVIAILGSFGDVLAIIGLNFLSILLACIFSIKQLRKLDGVTSEETVIS